MASINLGEAHGRIRIDSSELKEADIVLRQAGRGLLGFGTAAVAAFGYVIKVGADFEKQMDFVKAVTGETAETMKQLEEAAIELGKQGPYGPREVAESFVDLAKAGLTAKEIIDGAAQATIGLAAAGDLPLATAAEIAVNTMRTFGIEAENLSAVIDVFAGAANASTIDVTDMATSLKYAGAIAAAVGVSFDDVAAALAIIGNQGIRGSTAGTSLRRIFLNLTPTTKAATDAMKELGVITEDGSNQFLDAAGNTKPLAEVFQILKDATAGLPANKVKDLFNAIFGARAIPTALILTEQGAAGFSSMMDQIGRTTAADVAAERLDNLSGALSRLNAAIEAVFIEAGTPFQDFLKEAVLLLRELVLWFGELPDWVQSSILGFIGLAGVLALVSGAFLLTVGNTVRAIRVAAELAHVLPILTKGIGGLSRSLFALAANPVVLVILAIVAAVALLTYGIYKLYTENEKFREAVDATWQWIQKAWDAVLQFFRDLPDTAKRAWKILKEEADQFWDALVQKVYDAWHSVQSTVADIARSIGGFFGDLASDIGGFFGALGGMAGRGIASGLGAVVDFFQAIPRTAGGFLGDAAGLLGDLFGFIVSIPGRLIRTIGNAVWELPYIVGYAIGFMVGRTIRQVMDFIGTLTRLGTGVVGTILKWFVVLPGKIIEIFTGIINTVVGWGASLIGEGANISLEFFTSLLSWIQRLPRMIFLLFTEIFGFLWDFQRAFGEWAITTGRDILFGIVDFLRQLPAMVFGIMIEVLQWILTVGSQWVQNAINFAYQFVTGIINWVSQLPARIALYLFEVLSGLIRFGYSIFQTAFDIGKNLFNGLISGIGDLWGAVYNRFLSIINGVKNLAGAAWQAAKDFASGLWEGFKKGLGISSPSYIEEAAWQLEANVGQVLKNLQSQVGSFQSIGSVLPDLAFAGANVGVTASAPETEGAAAGQGTVVNGPLFFIQEMHATEDTVVHLSRELKSLIDNENKAAGVRILTIGPS